MNDKPRLQVETRYGDGTARMFQMSGTPIVTGAQGAFQPSAFVAGAGQWTSTGATFDAALGTVSFSGTISANSAFQVTYTYATFSDDEINFITGAYGDMYGMRLALVDALMADAYKRAKWGAARGVYYDDTKTMDNLMQLRSAIIAARTTEQGPIGEIISWGDQQQYYG